MKYSVTSELADDYEYYYKNVLNRMRRAVKCKKMKELLLSKIAYVIVFIWWTELANIKNVIILKVVQ